MNLHSERDIVLEASIQFMEDYISVEKLTAIAMRISELENKEDQKYVVKELQKHFGPIIDKHIRKLELFPESGQTD